ncbi:MAG: response regulator [Anaerolineae bacterium]|jgi:two-component system cell cycle response regulator|nr:response regulator [Anaerolineae bacterium]
MEIPDNLLEGWKIVVIDDEEDSLEVAQVILDAYGANVHTASNGEAGLEIVRHTQPSFVISDLSMPTMDGWGFINAMKSDVALSHIPVIALTAHAMVGDRERAVGAGFHNYLTKPLTVDTFMADLLKLLVDIPSLAENLNI